MKAIIRCVGVVLAVCVVGACSGAGATREVSGPEGLRWVTGHLQSVGEGAQRIAPLYRTLDEVLPNVAYLYPDGRKLTYTQLAVLGRFVDVEEGKGFAVEGDDAPSGTPVDFDDDDAKWRSVHAEFAVERGIGGAAAPDKVRVALPLYDRDKLPEFRAGLKELGTVVLFLQTESPLNDYDESLHIVFEHQFMAKVGDDGARTLSLPFVDEAEAARLVGSPARTLADLDQAARSPRTIPLLPGPGTDAPVRP